jgi:hypothetical protein
MKAKVIQLKLLSIGSIILAFCVEKPAVESPFDAAKYYIFLTLLLV